MIRLAEAKTVTLRERRWLRRLQQLISRSLPSATLVLYRSAARGTRSADSDYDLVILTPSPLTVEQRDAIRAQIYDFELAHGLVLALAFYSHAEWASLERRGNLFHQMVEQEGIRIE